jgi:RNA polymerase sigma-70 factor (ECF subfamily)
MAAGAVDRLFREHFGRAVAALIRAVGDWDLAEEAVQDAFAAAVERWPRDGIPRDPAAWIVAVARNRAIDRLRRERAFRARAPQLAAPAATSEEEPSPVTATSVSDERLRLIFACCHPALAPEAQVALTLRLVGGLSTAEVAHAFLVPESTMAQRLSRAKAKIRVAGIPFRVPGDEALPERLDAVLGVVYLVFNEGYAASAGDAHVRRSLCAEAIRLSVQIAELMPDEPEALGLQALLLAHDARKDARVDATGALVLLEDQDRGRWDAAAIDRATRLAARALRLGPPRRYVLEAAIAVEHANAPTAADTRWDRIAAYYEHMAVLAPDPVVELNRSVAIAMAGDVAGGLARIDALAGALDRYHYFHAARADLLERLGAHEGAADAYARAAGLAGNAAEKAFLERRYASAMAADPDCLFCKIVAGEIPSTRVDEDDRTVAFMDINPATRGHLLVVPRAHSTDLLDIRLDDLTACAQMAQKLAGRARERLGADGVNLLNSCGRAAWQTVFHFHVHVIPRYAGDPLRLPWVPGPGDRDEIAAAASALMG